MKLQFAFGNPSKKTRKKAKKTKKKVNRRKKVTKVKKSKKILAKRRKSLKTKHKPKRLKGLMKRKKVKKSSYKASTLKGRKRKEKKNPEKFAFYAQGEKGKLGKKLHSGIAPTFKDFEKKQARLEKAKQAYLAVEGSEENSKKKRLRNSYKNAIKALVRMKSDVAAHKKLVEAYDKEGAILKTEEIMAKKKKAKKAKKATKKVTKKAKKAKKATKKKVVAKAKVKKTHKKKAHKSKARKTKKRKTKMITHRHSAKTGHFKKGSKVKFKKTIGSGSKKMTLSGFFKLNPSRRNPMSKIKDLAKSATKLDTTELTSLAIGGALVPVINSGIGKIPYADKVVGFINEYVGPQATGSIVPMLIGAVANIASEQFVKDAQTKKHINAAADGLIAAGVIGLTMSISQKYVVEGMMSGVLFSPMSGVNYTPMAGVNYTPMAGVPQLAGPDFGRAADYGGGAGYTQSHRFSKADFGRAMDEDSDELATEDDINSENLSGGMG